MYSNALPRRLVFAVSLGTLLNPFNSLVIAVALGDISRDMDAGVSALTWLVAVFYITSSVAQPVMGRLADQIGPRRVFVGGLAGGCIVGAAAPIAPDIGWLVLARVVQAISNSTAFPAGMAMMRAVTGTDQTPARALGSIQMANWTAAALGPAIGGILVTAAGWPLIFAVNVPLSLIAIASAHAWLPADCRVPSQLDVAKFDLPGAVLFLGALGSGMAFLHSLSADIDIVLLVVCALLLTSFLVHQRYATHPLLDVFAASPKLILISIYVQFAVFNTVYYAYFFGLSLWLAGSRGATTESVGLVLFIASATSSFCVPVIRRFIAAGHMSYTITGGVLASAIASFVFTQFHTRTSLLVISAAAALIGVAAASLTLGLQVSLYKAAPSGRVGAASGLFQTSRYVGAMLSTSLLGGIFDDGMGTPALHELAWVCLGISTFLGIGGLGIGRRKLK